MQRINNIRSFAYMGFGACALLPISLLAQNKQTNDLRKPNVIIIYADDLGYGDLQCYGATRVSTPSVNHLATSGIRFLNAHATASTSTPSRYSVLTGEYAWRRPGTDIAAGNVGMIIRPERYTIADMFKNTGYATGVVGKWHLGLGDKTGQQDWNAPLPTGAGDLGFDYSYIMAATGDRVPCVFIENGCVVNYDPSAPIEVSYTTPFKGEPLGKDHPELLYNLKASHGHDMAIVNGIGRIGYMKGGGKALWKDENIADSLTTHAVDFINKNRNHPFFLYLATNDVHVPRFPHVRFRGKSSMGLRGEAILQFDWTVGKVIEALEKADIRNNTLIILSSDNGPVLDDGYVDRAVELAGTYKPGGPFRGGKYSAFEAGTCVPAIVSWPEKIKKEQVTDVLVSQIDWFRSLATLIGATLPQGAAPDSFDRLGNWLGQDTTDRRWVIEQAADHTLSVRTKDWKYIEPSDGEPNTGKFTNIETGYRKAPSLYDMRKVDEQEEEALKHPEIVFQLQEILKDVRALDLNAK